MKKLIEIKDITKRYKNASKDALKNVSFDIFEKEILTLLGVNGAGKTTISSIISSLIKPNRGDIFYQGLSIYKDITKYRHIIGFCPQFQNLDTDLNVWDNLKFSGKYYGLSNEKIKERRDFLLKRFNLEEYKKADLKILSGGYKRRFMLARSLMHFPKLLILDEPTVGLDPKIRRELWMYILELKKQGVSILLTTHYLDEADILSDRICIIDDGKIKTIDSPENLKKERKNPNLEEIFLHLLKEQKDED